MTRNREHSSVTKRKTTAARPGRGPNGRQDEINLQLRQEIRRGVYAPGTRLPTRAELQQRYNTTPVTVQKALDRMTADGFIRSAGRNGTFVVDHPPCLANYAVVYPLHLDSQHREVTFWRVLANLAKRNPYGPQRRFTIYTDLNGHVDEPDYRRLRHDVHARKLAGILFASSPHLLFKTPLLAEIMAQAELPRVAFMSHATYPGIPVVTSGDGSYLDQALDFFRDQGRRRLAVIGTAQTDGGGGLMPFEAELVATAAKRGIEVRPYWVQAMHSSLASRTRPLAQLLMQGAPEDRPDALLILDDSLVEAATAGVADAGLTGTDDVTIVGHANFPEPPFAAVPITRLGFDVEDVLANCLDVMDRQRRGEAVPEATPVAATFADDRTGRRRKSAA